MRLRVDISPAETAALTDLSKVAQRASLSSARCPPTVVCEAVSVCLFEADKVEAICDIAVGNECK